MSYMSKYMKDRYRQRRKEAVELLGSSCAVCGCDKEGELDIDHKCPMDKKYDGARMTMISHDKFLDELSRCQILCKKCHAQKTTKELGRTVARDTHGTLSSYRYCKCPLCKKAKSDWQRKYREGVGGLPA